MPVDLLVPDGIDREAADLAVWAEKLGYDGVWLGELWGRSAVVTLTDVARRTSDVSIGTAILNVFSRSPAVLAMTAASLDDVSDGRFRLGVGTSTEKAVEDLHGMEWAAPNPVRRAHETIELAGAFLAGEGRVEYDGQIFSVRDFPALDADVPIYHAALGEANRRVVARVADGWIPHNVPFPDLEDAHRYIRDVMDEEGRDASIDVAPYVPAVAADDPDVARNEIRRHVAYYVGSGRGYEAAVARRFPEEASAVAAAWRSGDRDRAVDAVTDDMVAALGVAGTPDAVRRQFRSIATMDVIDRPIVTIPETVDADLAEKTIEALAPEKS